MFWQLSKIISVFVFLVFSTFSYAQTPTSCFEIESILVDACGSPEGENEMVRFKVGPSPLNTSNINVTWPNNAWLGLCQNATTASAVASLNSTIQSCGFLIEPTGGILPAGANVLLVTSTAIDVSANSFANLGDTLYVIFQCSGNTAGHFANYNTSPGLRTLIINFSPPINCADTVTYDRTMLVNQSGSLGGSSAQKNGALANFNWNNTVSYDNFGCQAPFIPLNITASNITSSSICSGDSIELYVSYSGTISTILWNGNNGFFNSTINDTTTYYAVNDNSNFYITVQGVTSTCSDTIKDSILITINPPSNFIDNISICQGQIYTLPDGDTTSQNGSFIDTLFNASATGCDSIITSNITVIQPSTFNQNISICQGQVYSLPGGDTTTQAGNYIDTLFNASFIGCDSIITTNITVTASVSYNQNITICQGDSYLLPGGNTVNANGLYIDTLFNASIAGCDSIITTNLTVNNTTFATQSISICQGQSHTLPSGTVVNTTGIYLDTLFNSNISGCDSVITTNLTVTTGNGVYIIESDTSICEGDTLIIHAANGTNYLWSNGEQNIDSIIIFTSGNYTVNSTNNGCITSDNIIVNQESCIIIDVVIPNVFTPNNDLNNDVFKIVGTNITDVSAKIYNRWGQLIYEWIGFDNGWNGENLSGKEVPTGTYYYIINVVWLDGTKELFKGNISLLRQ